MHLLTPTTALQLLSLGVTSVSAVPALSWSTPLSSSSSSSTSTTSLSTSSSLSDSTISTLGRLASYNPAFREQAYERRISADASLSQAETNGHSQLGTFDAPQYNPYARTLDDTNCPWGNKTAGNTNAYVDAPDTGFTRVFEWTIERATLAPDGVSRSMILVDGSFPGPTIEANWGDTINVTVHNRITGPEEGTSIHWHGFLQKGTPWEDGVPGVTQCPIAPGESFTYSFKAELYGTSWWHAHYSAQYSSGVYGAIIVHGPKQDEIEYDVDAGPVLIADHFHRDYFSIVEDVMGTNTSKVAPRSDNNLINGKGIFDCNTTQISPCYPNAGLSKFNFTSGQTYRLRLINAGSEGLQKFSIDDHELTVIAYDFVPIQPFNTTIVTLGVGQRADILVKANQDPGSAYWMRTTMTAKCSLTNQPIGLAMVYYENANMTTVPSSTAFVDNTDPCANDDLSTAVPYFPIAPSMEDVQTQNININLTTNATGHLVWEVNNSTFRTDYNRPILHDLLNGVSSTTFPLEWNTYDFGEATTIRIIINNLTPITHPMHIHGHNMYVLSATNNISANPIFVNPYNPTRRDVQLLPPHGQITLQIDADNPGVWPLHCHVAWHVSGGLYMNVIERSKDIPSLQIPQENLDMCTKWKAWTAGNVPDQIDSGLRAVKKRTTPRAGQISEIK